LKTKTSNLKQAPSANGRSQSVTAGKKREKPEHGTSLLTAFQEIRELIVHGKMSPGTWIVEAAPRFARPFTGCNAKAMSSSIATSANPA